MKIKVLVSTTIDDLVEIDDQMNMNDEEIKQFCNDVLNGKEINEYPLNYNVIWSISSDRKFDIIREK